MSTEPMNDGAGEAVAFSPEAEARFETTIAKYPNRRAALLPVLYIAQEDFGFLSVPVMEYVAERLELPPSKVLQVATFYTMYYKKPHGTYHIEVCTSVPCCMMGGYGVVRHLEEKLDIRVGETTPDGRFTLTEAECLAGCGHAPLMQINGRYHERLTPERIDEILDDLS